MKKNKLKEIVEWQNNFICMNERHMQIQDNAIVRKDEEIIILTNACKTLKNQLEETQQALDRSREMVETLRLNSESQSLREMAKDLYELYYQNKFQKSWEYIDDNEKWHWITLIVQILSWKDLLRR